MHLRISISGMDTALTLLRRINERMGHMATQDDVTRLTGKVTAIGEGVARIRQDFADFKAANPGADVTALEASIDAVGADVAELDGEYPAVEPTPEPDPQV